MKRFLQIGILLLGGLFAFLGGEAQVKHSLTIRVKARTEVTGQPVASSKVCELSPLTLGVKVTGEGAVAYRWLKKTGTATYTELPGATSDTLRIVSASPVDAGDYVCEVTGECNADTSAVANVVVDPAPTLSFPLDLDACSSAPQDVDLTFTGTAPFTYRITGDTEDRTAAASPATITLGPSVTTTYKLVSLTDGNGCHALKVEGGELAGPVDNIAPGVPFTVRSLSGAEVKARSRILYSWTVNGTAVEGSGDTLLYTAATGGDYHFVRTAQIGELESSVAEVTVTVCEPKIISAGSISYSGGEVCTNAAFTISNGGSATSTCGAAITYEWFRNNVSIGNNAVTLAQSDLANGTYTYYRKAKLSNGQSANSSSISVTVCEPKIINTGSISYSGGEVFTNGAFSIGNSAAATSTCGAIMYEWFCNNVSIGNNAATLSQSGLANGTYTYYRKAKLSNGLSANSSSISVTVKSWLNTAGWSMSDDCTSCTWQEAINRCNALGMRLPNDSDWGALPKTPNVLGLTADINCWSATEPTSKHGSFWFWSRSGFLYGEFENSYKVDRYQVRCVRK